MEFSRHSNGSERFLCESENENKTRFTKIHLSQRVRIDLLDLIVGLLKVISKTADWM